MFCWRWLPSPCISASGPVRCRAIPQQTHRVRSCHTEKQTTMQYFTHSSHTYSYNVHMKETMEASLYLGQVEQDADGQFDDLHVRLAPVTAADQCVDHSHCIHLHHPLTAGRGQASRNVWGKQIHAVVNNYLNLCTLFHKHSQTLQTNFIRMLPYKNFYILVSKYWNVNVEEQTVDAFGADSFDLLTNVNVPRWTSASSIWDSCLYLRR